MKSLRVILAFALLSLTFTDAAIAQTEDQTPVTMTQFSKRDTRLSTLVAIKVNGVSLRKLFAAITLKTGVPLHAERLIEERRVTLSVPPTPAYKLLDNLMLLFTNPVADRNGYYWSKQAEGDQTAYTLYQTGRDRELEVAYRDRRTVRFLQCFREIQVYLKLDEAKRLKFHANTPMLRGLQEKHQPIELELGPFFTNFFHNFTEVQLNSLVEQRQIFIPATPYTQDELGEIVQRKITKEELEKFRTRNIQISLSEDNGFHTSYYYCKIRATLGIEGAAIGYAFDTADPAVIVPKQKVPQITVDLLKGVPDAEKERVRGELIPLLAKLTPQVEMPIYAEVFHDQNLFFPRQKDTLQNILDSLCERFTYGYEIKNGDCFLRSREWAEKRYNDVPEPYFSKWQLSREKNKHFLISDLIEMAHFRDEQIDTIEQVTHSFRMLGRTERNLYRLLYGLRESDLKKAEYEGGLILSLNNEQLQILDKATKGESYTGALKLLIAEEAIEETVIGNRIEIQDSAGKILLSDVFQWQVPNPKLNYRYSRPRPYKKTGTR